MNGFQYKLLSGAIAAMLVASILYVGREAAVYVTGRSVGAEKDKERICVVVDAGHGGDDPGKVGINGVNEKDVNLQIAELVKVFLEANDEERLLAFYQDNKFRQFDTRLTASNTTDQHELVQLLRLL